MKKLLLVFCTILLVACKNGDSDVCIGIDLPLSGDYAYWGNEFKQGVDIYMEGAENISLMYEDNQGIPNAAVTAASKLINIDRVDVLVSLFAPFSFPLRDIAEKANVPLLSSFNSSTAFCKGYDYSYTDFATHDMQLPLLVDYITQSETLNNGVYYCVNDDYGTDGARVISQLFAEKNIPIAGEYFNSGESNHRNTLAKLLTPNIDFVFVIARDKDLISAVNQIRERNHDIVIMGVGSFDAPDIWTNIPIENQNNIYFASSYFDKDYNDESRKFYDRFYEINGRDPNYPAIFGYTIVKYLHDVYRNAELNNTSINDELLKLDVESIRGQIKMQENHMIYSDIAIYKRIDGKSVALTLNE